MSPHKKALEETLKNSQKIPDFKDIAQSTKNIKIDLFYDKSDNPSYFEFETGEYGADNNLELLFNTAYPKIKIPVLAIHEGTHILQKERLTALFIKEMDCNVTSQIGYDLVGEAHAYSNQSEFVLRHYLNALSGSKIQINRGIKDLDTIYKSKKCTKEEHRKNPDTNGYFFSLYLNAFRQDPLYSVSSKKECIETIRKFHENANEESIQNALIEGRKNVFRGFFDVTQKGTRAGRPNSIKLIQDYISDTIKENQDYKNDFNVSAPNLEMPFNVTKDVFKTGDKIFVPNNFIQNTLRIKTFSDIAEKYTKGTKLEEEIRDLTNPIPATAWRQRKRFGL